MNVDELLARARLPFESRLPSFAGATDWLNTAPLTPDDLRGKVVAVDFWTFTCINWLRTRPYIRAWAERYKPYGLIVVGVHTPEFEIEHDLESVRRAAKEMRIDYPIAIDNDYRVWDAFANSYWPALYIADTDGRIRHHHFGEGGYERSEHVIQHLLGAAGTVDVPMGDTDVEAQGIEAPANWRDVRSQETYVGLARSEGFVSPGRAAPDEPHEYTAPDRLELNQWALAGNWTLGREAAVLNAPNGRIAYRFHARDLHLILTPPANDASARFRVTLDGETPGDAHGLDVDEGGNGVIAEPRLHQLIRQRGQITDRQFEIEILDVGAAALCFTFG
jgi:hypothetical protein